jgi:hypothetical protein
MKLVPYWMGVCFLALSLAKTKPAQSETMKLTGWFACEKCTASRVAKGDLRPSNPVCAKECTESGSEAVFLSEQGRELLKVRNYAGAKDDFGYHIEVTGVVDAKARTISIETVKQLSYEGASCARPSKNRN